MDSASNHQNAFTETTRNYFCQLVRNARRSFVSKVEGAKIQEKIFGDIFCDIVKVPKFKKKSLVIDCVTDFQQWLVERLWLKDRDELVSFLQYSSNDSSERPRRRPLQSRDERKRGYNFSKLNSEMSIHRSNSIIWCK